jgi:hypothetical protein
MNHPVYTGYFTSDNEPDELKMQHISEKATMEIKISSFFENELHFQFRRAHYHLWNTLYLHLWT